MPHINLCNAAVYSASHVELEGYFDEMMIPHVPQYAYGENLPVLSAASYDRFSMNRAYETFARRLVDSDTPWEGRVPTDGDAADRHRPWQQSFFALAAKRLRLASPILSALLLLISLVLAALATVQAARERNLNEQLRTEGESRSALVAKVEQLMKENAELSGPAKAIGDLRRQVDDLTNQLAEVTQAKTDAEQRALSAQDATAAAQRAASVAQAARDLAKQETAKTRDQLNKCLAALK